MEESAFRAIAIVGVGAILPDAPNVPAFWENVKNGRYSISDVTPDRWDAAAYFDPDPVAPAKTYSKIGGWVREFPWDPAKWRLPLPPRVVDGMDDGQKWAVSCTRQALQDYGYPDRPFDPDRTAVILGNAMGGEKHYITSLRIFFPEYARELAGSASFAALPESMQRDIQRELHSRIEKKLPVITEDTMPGELANCIAGRIANLFNFHGPNYIVDAACASAMAAVSAAADGLIEHDYDVAITGGIDHNMGVSSFVKFCKIGALSATGTRPYAEGADGFVMGEGAAVFLLKRLADAERDGDKIYAVLRGVGGASDGKGKGITAPNPVGQRLAVERAWKSAGLSPATVTLIEGHGTSTRVGDVVEVQSMIDVLNGGPAPQSIALGSVKSNIGHLKAAAGAAGLLKATLAIRDKVLPPSLNCQRHNPGIDFAHSPLFVNTELQPWTVKPGIPRRAGVSAFGFGGTNFHMVLEEHIPHALTGNGKRSISVSVPGSPAPGKAPAPSTAMKAPLRGALVIGAPTGEALAERLRAVAAEAQAGRAPAPALPAEADLRAPERIAIDYGTATELADRSSKALKALVSNQPAIWKALRAQGVFRGSGPAPKVAFLYTGQGSQYVNMLQSLRATEPIVAETFAEADRVMTPLLGKPLSDFIFIDGKDAGAVAKADEDLRQTAITQPAVLATDQALTKLLAAYGIEPDMTMGHSLGEYGALVAAGALPFEDALEAVSARGREMTRVSMGDNGRMAAVFAPIHEIERVLKTVDGYAVIANLNSDTQAVIGGAANPVEQASERLLKAGYNVVPLQVSHAFHTSIVAPASEPLRRMMDRLRLTPPRLPIVANVTGEFYPMGPDVREQMLDMLGKQVAAPVQFATGLRTLYKAGARIFVEVGPKKALQGFAEDVLGPNGDVLSLFTNHPKFEDTTAFNQALCGLYAFGLGRGVGAELQNEPKPEPVHVDAAPAIPPAAEPIAPVRTLAKEDYVELGRMFADVIDRGMRMRQNGHGAPPADPVVITGAALGLPGTGHIFDDSNVARILRGEQLIDTISTRSRKAILDKHITRLVKTDNGGPTFETIDNIADVIKLAGRGNAFDLHAEFGVPTERVIALDRCTELAVAAGLDALRDAGVPLVLRHKTTSIGTQLPDRWMLPEPMRDDTGVIFASVFPGYDSFAGEAARYYADQARRDQIAVLEDLRNRVPETNSLLKQEITNRITELRAALEKEPYVFDRRFLFHILSMGHSQFAEYIGARGPNTQLNAACASTTQAVSVAEDWIRNGRCRRVVIVSADDITTDNLIGWFGAGFLASGAAATGEVVEEVAVPFDRRRHGMVIGMGAAALVVESAEAARERGIRPICEVLSAITANSAFHGTRLDVDHIANVMDKLVRNAEERSGISRADIAAKTVFVSHETYTPARGGSASAEINALRKVFGERAVNVVIANTKGFTGHAMGAGIEDVVAVKALETGCVPPVANYKEPDPELGPLNLSKGGMYPVEYALRLGAGFGSQISMTLYRWVASPDRARPTPTTLGYGYRIADKNAWDAWLSRMAGRPVTGLEVVNRTLRIPNGTTATPQPEQVAQMRVVEAPPAPQHQPAKTAAAVVGSSPVVAAPAPPPAATAADPVKERVLALVAEKTGYPVDMLALDLDLEADLGVDTVKQAEVFATIREAYGIQRDDKIRLREFPTLAHVIGFVHDRRPDLAPTRATAPLANAAPAAQPAGPAPAPPATDAVREALIELVVEKTGYPKDMLALDLDLEADLGVDTVKQAELFASIREKYGIPRDPNLKLRDFPTLSHVIGFVYDRRPDLIAARNTAPAEPAVAPVPAVSAAAPATMEVDPVKERLIELVVEKTGYPKDMLDLDLDLEADLGVDTVKQAELFASIRESYTIPRDPNLKLRDFPTLAHVIQFVYDRRPDLVAAKSEAAPVPAPARASQALAEPPSASAPVDAIQQKVMEIVADKTGYPMEMLDLELDLEADLGIDTVKQAEMFASVRAAFNIERDTNMKLRDFPTLAHVIQFARDRQAVPQVAPEAPAPAPVQARPAVASFDAANRVPRRVPGPVMRPPLESCKPTGVDLGTQSRVIIMSDAGEVGGALTRELAARGVEALLVLGSPTAADLSARIQGWLAAGPIQGVYWLPALDNEGPLDAMDLPAWREALRVRVKLLYATMRTLYEQIANAGTFLVSATHLGGLHGYEDAGATAPLGGAVTGFTKTYKRERPDALVKAVDFADGVPADQIAAVLINETVRDPGAVEIGYRAGQRWTIALREEAVPADQPGLVLNNETVFVITGAAGSIVSAITSDLAAASGGTFYLLDVAPAPKPDDTDVQRFISDREGLKRDIFARIQARGERATPALVEKELATLERVRAAYDAMEAVRIAGGTAHYFQVNLTDAAAVGEVIEGIRHTHGRIDALLHAAGVERSHFLPAKSPEEFDLVFDVKSDGWFNLMHAIGSMPVGATVAFSSIAGRFGNGGQADYSAANDLLCKIASSFRSTRPETRGIAIDWTAWGGIGMATRGSIPKMMEAAGIDMLPPEAGIPLIRRELTMSPARGEILFAGRLGILVNEYDPTGGLESKPAVGVMTGRATSFSVHKGLEIETVLDPAAQPFLHDHQIEGTPVLPGVMGVEAFAEAALALMPGWHVAAIEDVNFLAPFKFYKNEPRTVYVRAVFRPHPAGVSADCVLEGRRTLAGQTEAQVTTHFTARVLLSEGAAEPVSIGATKLHPREPVIGAEDIYKVYFHGPAYQVLKQCWHEGDRMIGELRSPLPPECHPAELRTVALPRLIELGFQTAGLWDMTENHRMGLPLHIDNVSFSPAEATAGTICAVVTPRESGASFDAEVIDEAGNCYVALQGYRTVTLSNDVVFEVHAAAMA